MFKKSPCPGISFKLLLGAEEQRGNGIDALARRVIGNNSFSCDSAELGNEFLPLCAVREEAKADYYVEGLVGKRQIYNVPHTKVTLSFVNDVGDAFSAGFRAPKYCHGEALLADRNGKLTVPPSDIEDGRFGSIFQKAKRDALLHFQHPPTYGP